jgi:hypothetical protein
MQTYYTTSTGPGWSFDFTDSSGNAPPGFASATFSVIFRSLTTLQHIIGQGTISIPASTTGIVDYLLGTNDLANAYALASPAMLPGEAIFEILASCVANGLRYDGSSVQIKIKKI